MRKLVRETKSDQTPKKKHRITKQKDTVVYNRCVEFQIDESTAPE